MNDDQRYAGGLDRILELVVLLNDDMTRSLAERGLSASRTTVLWTLRRVGACPQKTLAEALGVTARAITGLVDGLAASGLVTRQPHPTDRRATMVTLTDAGTAVVEALEGEQREFGRQLFGAMPRERFDGLIAGLDDVLGTLRRLGLTVGLADGP